MSSNQLHGKTFEDLIKGCGLFPGSSDAGRSVTSGFDIEARFDRKRGLPTSVKTTGNDTVTLADARRFFAIDQDFRMLVGRYRQDGEQKTFSQVHEFILTRAALADLRGEMDCTEVTEFHEGLLLSRFPKGQHQAARTWARQRKDALAGKSTRIILNPKIDSKTQRRLQCSVTLSSLIAAAKTFGEYTLHERAIGSVVLPIAQISKRREFRSAASG